MGTLSQDRKVSQTASPEKQDNGPASTPSVVRSEIFERMRTASEGLVANRTAANADISTPLQPSVTPERAQEVEKRAQDLYRSMHGGLTGWGTEEAEVLNALKGLTPAETQLLREVYATRFNCPLENDLASELSAADLVQAHAALRGDRAVETATELHRAMNGAGTDEEAIVKTLSSLKPEEHDKVAQAYRAAYGVELDTALAREFSGDDLTRVRGLRMGQPETAAAAELHNAMAGVGTNEAVVLGVLKRHSSDEMQAIAREYQRLYGVSLEDNLASELSGHQQSEARYLARGERTGAKVAQLRGALEGAGTAKETIFAVLEGTTAQQREAIQQMYESQSGTSLQDALNGDLSGSDLEKANTLLTHGKLSDVEKLRFALEGAGTDEAGLKEVLRNRSKEEVEELKKEYEVRYQESLEARIHVELDGSEKFRALQALKGRPASLEEALTNLQELDAFERSGGLSGVIGAFSQEDDRIQDQLAFAKFDLYGAQRDGVITPQERASIERTLRFAEGNIDLHAETRDAIADTGATVAAVAGSTVVIIGTGGIATPGVVAAAAAVGGASYAGTKYAVQGKGYDGENLASDIGIGAVEGAITAVTMGTASAVKNAAQQGVKQAVTTGSQAAMRETVVESAGATVQDALRPDTWAGGAAAGVANLAVSAAGTAITSGAIHRATVVKPPLMQETRVPPTSRTPQVEAPSVAPSQAEPLPMGDQRSVAREPSLDTSLALNTRAENPLVSTEHFRFSSQGPKDWALALATSPEHRTSNLAPELHEVRLGIPGRVRTLAELSDAQVAQVLNGQLNHVTEAQIRDLIASLGPERSELTTQVLSRLSRSGNLDVMSDIAHALHRTEYENKELYSPLNGSLVDTLKYIANEKQVLRCLVPQNVTTFISPNSIVLLDRDVLQLLKTDTKFVEDLVANKVSLVHPAGFIGGINPFNSPGLGDIKDRVHGVLTRVEALRTRSPEVSTEVLITQALEGNVLAELNAIDPRLVRQLDFIQPSQTTAPRLRGIVDSLNGSPGMREDQVAAVLSKLDEPWRPLAREAVVQLSEVQSHRSMAALAREQFEKIRSFAHSEGVAMEDVIFAVDGDKYSSSNLKSYGIATYIFKEANEGKVRSEQFVSMNGLAQVVKERAGRPTLVVVIDDFSGSGSSLLDDGHSRGKIRWVVGPTVPIVCAPYVATTSAFEKLSKVRANDPHTTMIPGRVVTSMSESDLYTVDNAALRVGLEEVIGGSEYLNSMPHKTLISMPYMGPDNNGALFGRKYFNPYFIVNGKEGVCKTSCHISPGDTGPLENIVRREVSFVRSDLSDVQTLSPSEGLKMAKRVEELTVIAQQLNILQDTQGEIQAAINEVARKCRGQVRRVTNAVGNVGEDNTPKQLLLEFEAARELSRRLSFDDLKEQDVAEVPSAYVSGGVS